MLSRGRIVWARTTQWGSFQDSVRSPCLQPGHTMRREPSVFIKTEHVGPSDVAVCRPLRVEPPTGRAPGQPSPEHTAYPAEKLVTHTRGTCLQEAMDLDDTSCHLGNMCGCAHGPMGRLGPQ